MPMKPANRDFPNRAFSRAATRGERDWTHEGVEDRLISRAESQLEHKPDNGSDTMAEGRPDGATQQHAAGKAGDAGGNSGQRESGNAASGNNSGGDTGRSGNAGGETGKNESSASNAPPIGVNEAEAEKAVTAEPEGQGQDDTFECGNCEAVLMPGEKFCPNCYRNLNWSGVSH